MRYVYPCTLTPDEGGSYVASFPDVPEALTSGDDRADALEMATDALVVALDAYVCGGEDIPVPSVPLSGHELVAVPSVVAAKLALYTAMREQNLTNGSLAKRLKLREAAVRKLLNPRRRSHMGQVENALRVVGRRVIVEDGAASLTG